MVLHGYAANLVNGGDDIAQDVAKSIEVCKEAASLGSKDAQRNLPKIVNAYAARLFNGSHGTVQDVSKAIEICREAVALGSKDAERNLPAMLSDYALFLINGENGFEKDTAKAIEICQEAANLGDSAAIINLPLMIESSQSTDSLSPSIDSLSLNVKKETTSGFKGNWTRVFETKVGDILHTPTMTQWGGITSGRGLSFNGQTLNDIPLLAPLELETNSTPEEFLAALQRSGLI